MLRFSLYAAVVASLVVALAPCQRDVGNSVGLKFEVTVAKGLLPRPTDGRLLLVFAPRDTEEPRFSIGPTGMEVPPLLGCDALGFMHGKTIVMDGSAACFPLTRLADLPRGEYCVQAVFDHNLDLRLPDAPGNLVSEARNIKIDPAAGVIRLELTRKLPDEKLPADTEHVRYIKFRSEKLSQFHGRPIYLRAGVILPPGHATDRDRRYPLRLHIGGFASRYTVVSGMMAERASYRQAWASKGAPQMLLLMVDGAGPLGDPYQVNSANHGPYGDALTQELIPHVEKTYRGIGAGHARVLDGTSTGGWVSLALQVFYPDFFNGAWSHAPDPVDFRAFELIDIYKDKNAFVNRHGFERPSSRELSGEVKTTVRHEVQQERTLGRGDDWTLSGKDWASWNAVFSPRGKNGRPVPIWDGKTGKIDPTVAEHWKKYDLRRVLQENWPRLGPKLEGKLRIWVGDADDYFLNNAVYLLDDFLQKARPPFKGKITYARRKGHSWQGLSERELMDQMALAVSRGK